MTNKATVDYTVSGKDLERMRGFINPDPNSGCWLWSGSMNVYGYGVLPIQRGDDRRWLLAHRAVYTSDRGPVSPDLCLDHKCRVRCCVNPDHLQPMTWQENLTMPNGNGPGQRTHCPRGHEYTPENTYHPPKRPNQRGCLTCRNIANAAQAARARLSRAATRAL